jgi:hypothetical protein
MLLAAGVELKTVSEIMGHSTSSFTADVYVKARYCIRRARNRRSRGQRGTDRGVDPLQSRARDQWLCQSRSHLTHEANTKRERSTTGRGADSCDDGSAIILKRQ